jgi:hypothetical protein
MSSKNIGNCILSSVHVEKTRSMLTSRSLSFLQYYLAFSGPVTIVMDSIVQISKDSWMTRL